MPSAPSQVFSLNPKITPELQVGEEPTEEELEELREQDPPLGSAWTLWEQISQADMKAQYADATRRVASFSTVKSFWRYWNHLPQPSILLEGKRFVRDSDGSKSVVDGLFIFRDGVKPEWEDSLNASGGHFQLQLKPSLGGASIDEYWNNIVLGMIGGAIEPADMITGVRLCDKLPQTKNAAVRIEVWFSNYADTAKVQQLQDNLEKCMATRLDGTMSRIGDWGKTDVKSHKPKS